MGKDVSTPDAGELRAQKLPELKFPGAGEPAFRVYFAPEAHDDIARHARQNTSVEVGGVLVGDWHRDADGPFVAVSHVVRCDAATSKSGEVTFTHEAWNVINREMDTRYAELKIVGWYHTHPTFGIFLSERDSFIHQHFFSNPGQIAYVVDPVAKTEGVFAWRGGKTALVPHYWVGDQIYAGADQSPRADAPQDGSSPAPQAAAAPQETLSSSLLFQGMLCLLVFLAGYLLAGMRSSWEQRMLVEGAVSHYGIWKGLRPGLGEHLDMATAALKKVDAAVEILAKEHVGLAGDEGAQKRGQWNEIHQAFQTTQTFLTEVRTRYALTPDENVAVAGLIAAKQAELQRDIAPAKPQASKEDAAPAAQPENRPGDKAAK